MKPKGKLENTVNARNELVGGMKTERFDKLLINYEFPVAGKFSSTGKYPIP
jgi:hypothetical protein